MSSQKPLSSTAIETLRMIAEKPRDTTVSGYGDYVSGRSAAALIRRGLAMWTHIPDGRGYSSRKVKITPLGRDTLARLSAERD